MCRRALTSLVAIVAGATAAFAQTPAPAPAPPVPTGPPLLTVHAEATFYGDNTEFFNPFRTGETILGATGRLFVDAAIDSHATLRVGAITNGRFVVQDILGGTRPLCALVLTKSTSRFIVGTLETVERRDGPGPDVTSPHGLLPPIQIETLAFTQPYEAGLQWTVASPRGFQDTWINWDRLNTSDHRESFDAGIVGHMRVAGPLSMAYQAHIVHHGGQLFSSGAVADSYAIAPGLIVSGHDGPLTRSAEFYWVRSSNDPNRSIAGDKHTGSGAFLRVAIVRSGWRGHVIVWHAYDFVKEDGDTNYQSVNEDGTFIRASRDYAEAGVTKLFLQVSSVFVEGSVRLHRVEDTWSYSYRILARVNISAPIRWRHP